MGTDMFGSWLLLVAVTLVWVLYKYLTWNHDFWKKRGVPYIKPLPVFGNIKDGILRKKTVGEAIQDLYWELDGHKFGGIFKFSQPALLIRDPELVKTVLVKDFTSFHDNDIRMDANIDPIFARNPFVLNGERWKTTRSQLVLAFTPVKLKPVFPLVSQVCQQLKEYIERDSSGIFEAKDLCTRFTTDVVASSAFGIEGNSIQDHNSEFRQMGRNMLEPSFFSNLKVFIVFIMPWISNTFKIRFFSKKFEEFFHRITSEVIKYRTENNITRNDYLQHLVNLKNKTEPEKHVFTDLDLTAAAITIFVDGTETSASALSFALYCLATNPDIQSRAREEVKTVLQKYGGQLTFDAIQEMNYLDMVLAETLRLYPPILFMTRTCTKPYKLDSSYEVEVGTAVIIPTYALHCDPQYFPNPKQFNPDRFTEENKKNRHKYVHLPFGEGPRICLGTRFAQMEVKAGIATIITNFELRPTAKTQIPLVFEPGSIFTEPKGGLWLQFCKIK